MMYFDVSLFTWSTGCILMYYIVFPGIMQQDNSEQVIIDPKLIAKHYIRTWFFLDLLSSIPLDYIFLIFNVGQKEVSTKLCILIHFIKIAQKFKAIN